MDDDGNDPGSNILELRNSDNLRSPQLLTGPRGRCILICNQCVDCVFDISHSYDSVMSFLSEEDTSCASIKELINWAKSITYPYISGRFDPDNDLFDNINTLKRQSCLFVDYCIQRFINNEPQPVTIDNETENAIRMLLWTYRDRCDLFSFEAHLEFADNLNRQGIENQLTRSIHKLHQLGLSFVERNLIL